MNYVISTHIVVYYLLKILLVKSTQSSQNSFTHETACTMFYREKNAFAEPREYMFIHHKDA